jgi:two-component system, LytTR family, response regulator
MALRTLIVDDEPLARKILREDLEFIEGVEVIGEADDGASALSQIAELKPDLVLLDLHMPVMGGLEVVRRIERGIPMPVIVVVTAHDKYAVQAFEAGAVDYLLKPVGQQRLAEAVERAKRVSGLEAAEKLARLQEIADPVLGPRPRKIIGKLDGEYFLLNAGDILAFQAEGSVVWIITRKMKYFATQTLTVLEERLTNANFRRIHRNALVNVDQVRKISALSSQRWLITLSNNQQFVASKRQARSVRQIMK